MKCQYCSNPSTVHMTEIIQKRKKELHLCEACARQHNLIPEPQQLNVPALLQLLLGQVAPALGGMTSDSACDECPACGWKYAQFRTQGRLGCPEDYDAFRKQLEPLLERIHRSVEHCGKVPARIRRTADLEELHRQLRQAIAEERYEEAAQLRDQIRSMRVGNEH